MRLMLYLLIAVFLCGCKEGTTKPMLELPSSIDQDYTLATGESCLDLISKRGEQIGCYNAVYCEYNGRLIKITESEPDTYIIQKEAKRGGR